MISTIQDITDINQIKSQAMLYRISNEITGDAVVVFDLNFCISEWNHYAEELFGYSFENVIGKSVEMLIPEYKKNELDHIMKSLSKGNIFYDFKTDRVHKNGTLIHLNASFAPLYDSQRNIYSYIGIYRKISKVEEIEQEFKEYQNRAIMALDGGNFGIWEYDYETKNVAVYNKLQKVFGYDEEKDYESVRNYKTWLSYFVQEDIHSVEEAFENHKKTGESISVEFRIVPNNQSEYRWIRIKGKTCNTFRDGMPQRVVGTYEDITTQKKNEILMEKKNNELMELARRAENADKAKSIFLANISHEIRTPLNGITMATKMLKEENVENPDKLIDMIYNSSNTLMGIVTDILDLSKAEQEGVKLSEERFSLMEILKSTYGEMQMIGNQKGLEVSSYLDPKLEGEYIGDAQKIKQILNNLTSNALKFTNTGMVGIRADLLEDIENSYKVKISIKDTGIGVGDQYLNKMFEPFSQENETEEKRVKGTGLGLAISKKYSMAMGGDIQYEKNGLQGSIFHFYCRLKKVNDFLKVETHENFSYHKQIKDKNKKILCVDDSLVNQELIKILLEKEGFEVSAAYSAKEVFQLMKQIKFDLILMDIQLPEMNGYKITDEIRKNKENERIPIMAMTAYARFEDKEKCLKAGMNDYITKPIDIERIIDKIDILLEENG